VVNKEGTLLGIIAEEELLQAVSHYNAASQPGGVIILQVHPNNFSISEIGRIVESNNAKIIHLNTWTDASSGQLMVAVKMNKSDIHDVLASFERYQYNVVQYFGENLTEDELKDNYEHLMNYLNI
jgi:phosphoribosylanthranilate isomerase